MTYSPCRCGCQPIILTGCGCQECRTGVVEERGHHHATLREILDEAGVFPAEPHYCLQCNNTVLTDSVYGEREWLHTCRKGHVWSTVFRL